MFGRLVTLLACAALVSEASVGVAAAAQTPPQPAPAMALGSSTGDVSAAAAKKKAKKIPAISVASDTATTVRVQILPKLTGKKVWKFTVQRPKTV